MIKKLISSLLALTLIAATAACGENKSEPSQTEIKGDYSILSELDITKSVSDFEDLFGEGAEIYSEEGVTMMSYKFDSPEKDALFASLPKVFKDYADKASDFSSSFSYDTGQAHMEILGMGMDASYSLYFNFPDENSLNSCDCQSIIDSINSYYSGKYQITALSQEDKDIYSSTYGIGTVIDLSGTVIKNYPAKNENLRVICRKTDYTTFCSFDFSVRVTPASEASSSSSYNDTSDGEVGDNNGDGVIDDKDWEIEWNDYINEKMKDY